MKVIGIILSVFLLFPAPASAQDMEHITRKGSTITVTDAASEAFYYYTSNIYMRANDNDVVVKRRSTDYRLVEDGTTTIEVTDLPGTWFVKTTVYRGYGASLVAIKTYRFVQRGD